jgi:predicted heme/steroid binding protein
MSGSHNSLAIYSTVLLGREEALSSLQENSVVVDTEELKDATGEGGKPLWLSIKGRVYDVTQGAAFYGPGTSYNGFTGRDATRAFCTGCLEPECLIASLDGLTQKQLKEADRW